MPGSEGRNADARAAGAPPTSEPDARDRVVGDLRRHGFRSRVFGTRRTLRVLLPRGYRRRENHGRRYPVLYLNDGQNLFDPRIAFGGVEWRVDEAVDRLERSGAIEPLIVVGIDHARDERAEEYLPFPLERPEVPAPWGTAYPAFLLQEVVPFVEGRYRTSGDPEGRGLGGSSLGALIALHTVIERPGAFGRLLLESPSVSLSGAAILARAAEATEWPERVALAIGTRETGDERTDRRVVRAVNRLAAILEEAGLGEDRLRLVVEEGGRHGERAWARRFPRALRFLYGSGVDRSPRPAPARR